MLPKMKCHAALLPLICGLLFPFAAVAGVTYECKMEKRQDEQVCVFRSVVYSSGSAANAVFKPAQAQKVQHVAFEDSTLEHVPKEFLSAFPDLLSLHVVQANLSSVVIPARLQRLFASNNRISKVIVHQTKESTAMEELMLDSNHLSDVTNLTRLVKLEILNLSGNRDLPVDHTVDLGRFKGLAKLRVLMLSDVQMLYLENENSVALPALEMLDVSNNDLITNNFDVKVFAPMKELHTLRLSHTSLTELNVMEMTRNNPRLKEVNLEGSNFKCDLLKLTLKHLHGAGIATPVNNKNATCMIGYEKVDDICCSGDALEMVVPVDKPTPPMTPEEGGDRRSTFPEGVTPTTTRMSPTNMNNNNNNNHDGRPPTVAPKLDNLNKESVAAKVTLGNSVLSMTVVVAIVKLFLF